MSRFEVLSTKNLDLIKSKECQFDNWQGFLVDLTKKEKEELKDNKYLILNGQVYEHHYNEEKSQWDGFALSDWNTDEHHSEVFIPSVNLFKIYLDVVENHEKAGEGAPCTYKGELVQELLLANLRVFRRLSKQDKMSQLKGLIKALKTFDFKGFLYFCILEELRRTVPNHILCSMHSVHHLIKVDSRGEFFPEFWVRFGSPKIAVAKMKKEEILLTLAELDKTING
tara:strand:+ start:78 stop:755 length:678 start_codon:yes stop_codon:yes gene_type:complete